MAGFNHQSGQYFPLDDARIYYEVIGKQDAPVLLFLHGGMGNIEDLNNIANDLATDYRIIGIDSRGQGKSTSVPRPSLISALKKMFCKY